MQKMACNAKSSYNSFSDYKWPYQLCDTNKFKINFPYTYSTKDSDQWPSTPITFGAFQLRLGKVHLKIWNKIFIAVSIALKGTQSFPETFTVEKWNIVYNNKCRKQYDNMAKTNIITYVLRHDI